MNVFSRGAYVVGGSGFTAFRVYVTRQNDVRGTCLVEGTYTYVNSSLQNTQTTEVKSAILVNFAAAEVTFGRGDRGISMQTWRVVNCRAN